MYKRQAHGAAVSASTPHDIPVSVAAGVLGGPSPRARPVSYGEAVCAIVGLSTSPAPAVIGLFSCRTIFPCLGVGFGAGTYVADAYGKLRPFRKTFSNLGIVRAMPVFPAVLFVFLMRLVAFGPAGTQ